MVEADKLSDRVAFINQGKIVALDTPARLKQRFGLRALKVEIELADGSAETREVTLDEDRTAQAVFDLFNSERILTVHSEEAYPGRDILRYHRQGVTGMIGALVVKDLKLFIRNRFFLVITALGLVVYPTIYYLIPDQVDESLGLAFYIEDRETPLYRELVEEPDDYAIFESEEEMLAALEETGDYFVGLSIPAQLSAAAARGEQI